MVRTLGTGEHSARRLMDVGALPEGSGRVNAGLERLVVLAERRQRQLERMPYVWLQPPVRVRLRALRPRARSLRSSVSPARGRVSVSSVSPADPTVRPVLTQRCFPFRPHEFAPVLTFPAVCL